MDWSFRSLPSLLTPYETSEGDIRILLIDHKFLNQVWYNIVIQTYQMISTHGLLISCLYHHRFSKSTVALLDFRSTRIYAPTIPGALRYGKP